MMKGINDAVSVVLSIGRLFHVSDHTTTSIRQTENSSDMPLIALERGESMNRG